MLHIEQPQIPRGRDTERSNILKLEKRLKYTTENDMLIAYRCQIGFGSLAFSLLNRPHSEKIISPT